MIPSLLHGKQTDERQYPGTGGLESLQLEKVTWHLSVWGEVFYWEQSEREQLGVCVS